MIAKTLSMMLRSLYIGSLQQDRFHWKFETMLNQVNLAKLSYCFIRVYPLQLDMIELKTRKHLELWSTAVTYCIDSPAIDAALVNHTKWLDVSEILQELKGLMLQEIRIKAFHEFPRPSLPQPRWGGHV